MRLATINWPACLCLLLAGCGSGSGSQDKRPAEEGISAVSIGAVGSYAATLSFSTTPAAEAVIRVWLASDSGDEPPLKTYTSGRASDHSVRLDELYSASA